uniref:Uncharacterized protein n=1 Tax=uncultured Flavobacteriia bacterium TaxID=212695 RepID=H6RGC1_9BACT|nr:hypothetical protein VIS_S3CIB80003 [uncultured Flavobacteriia bacterium]
MVVVYFSKININLPFVLGCANSIPRFSVDEEWRFFNIKKLRD